MKQIHLGALRARLLYAVVIVLFTCLLIVGGAYRMQTQEAQGMRADYDALLSEQDSKIQELRARIAKESKARADDDRRYLAPGVALLNEGLTIHLEQEREKNADLEQQVKSLRVLLSDKFPRSKNELMTHCMVDFNGLYARIETEREAHHEALARLSAWEAKYPKQAAKFRKQDAIAGKE